MQHRKTRFLYLGDKPVRDLTGRGGGRVSDKVPRLGGSKTGGFKSYYGHGLKA